MRVFITGGSRGIGEQLVKSCIQAGHDVAFTYLTAKDKADAVVDAALEAAHYPAQRCCAWQMDVSNSAQVESVCDEILDNFDGIDVVINNAATIRIGIAATLPDKDWDDVLATNLSGPFYVSRFFLNEFLINGRGRFIHISSIARQGMSGQVAYCASKAGLVGLSTALAKEYGRKNITSNVLSLGFFETDMTKRYMSEDRIRFWHEFCPAGRMGKVPEIAAACLFLMSDAAAFINGQTINLTGGLDWMI